MFIIKKHYEATESNYDFSGVVIDYYKGKRGETLSKNELPCKYFIEEYGFKTKAAASRALKAEKELCDSENEYGWWNVSASIMEV